MDADTIRRLTAAAVEASTRAHSPYSDFPVGAAVLAGDGRIFAGCNVENASYGLTVCAERNAVSHMVANGQKRIEAVAVYTPTSGVTPPCGACRQVLAEFGPKAELVVVCDGEERLVTTVAELLPSPFERR